MAKTYSEAEVRTVALAVIAGVIFGGMATGVAYPTLPLLDDVLLISAVVLSIILSANRISRLVTNAPAGNVIDRIGARRPMIAGLIIQALAPFGYLLGLHAPLINLGTYPLLGEVSLPGIIFIFARFSWGIGSAFVSIGGFVIITKVTTLHNRGKWIGYMRGGQSLGFPSGLIFGGIVTDVVSMDAAFLLAGILALTAGVVASLVLPDVAADTGQKNEAAKIREIPAIIAKRPEVLPIGLGNFTLQFLWGGVMLTTLVRYADVHELELSVLSAAGITGAVMGIGVVTSGATTVVSARISDVVSNRALITIPGFSLFAAGYVVIALFPIIEAFIVGIILMGIGMGSAAPVLLAILGDITEGDEVGRMGGVYNIFGDVGLSLGPLIGIPAADIWLGYQTTYLLSAGMLVLCLLVVTVPLLRNANLQRHHTYPTE